MITAVQLEYLEKLNDAKRFLAPHFGLEGELVFYIDDKKQEELLADMAKPSDVFDPIVTKDELEHMKINYFCLGVTYPNGDTGESELNIENQTDQRVGALASNHLYLAVNPRAHEIFVNRRKKPPSARSAKRRKFLSYVVSNIGGIRYATSMGSDFQKLLEEERNFRRLNQMRMPGDSDPDVFKGRDPQEMSYEEIEPYLAKMTKSAIDDALDEIADEWTISFDIAGQLYDARGETAIQELARLNYSQSRDYIKKHIGVDILNPGMQHYTDRPPPPSKFIN